MRLPAVVGIAAALVAACTPPAPPSPTVSVPTATTSMPSGTRAATATPRMGPAVVEAVRPLITGLEVPWAIALAPDGRLFFTERPGRVRVARFDGANAALDPQPWAAIPAAASGEGGLLGLALDPDFATNGFVYLYYSYRAPNGVENRLVRMRDQNGRGTGEVVLRDGIAGSSIHDGGRIRFGPDGKLYVGTGDGGAQDRAQNTGSPNGKVLRLNRDGSVPADDPFPSGVWSYGHRNVQGLAFHPDTHALYATEHGPSGVFPSCCNDEVDLILRGRNYGWPTVTGIPHDPRFEDPLAASGPTDTWAPSGATFLAHAGPLRGSFLFTALRGAHLHRVVFAADGRTVVFEERLLANAYGRLRDVYELPSGQLLVLTNNRDGRGSPKPEDDRILLVTLR